MPWEDDDDDDDDRGERGQEGRNEERDTRKELVGGEQRHATKDVQQILTFVFGPSSSSSAPLTTGSGLLLLNVERSRNMPLEVA